MESDEYSNPNTNIASNDLFLSRSYSTEDSNDDDSFSSFSLYSDYSSTSALSSFTPTVSILTSSRINTDTTAEQQRYHRSLRRERRMLRRQAILNEPVEETFRCICNNNNNNDNGADADILGSCTQINLYRIMNIALLLGTFHHAVLVVLHLTYVGTATWNHRISFFTGNDNSNSKNHIHTCLEYALDSCPPSHRSSYDKKYNMAYANMTLEEKEQIYPRWEWMRYCRLRFFMKMEFARINVPVSIQSFTIFQKIHLLIPPLTMQLQNLTRLLLNLLMTI